MHQKQTHQKEKQKNPGNHAGMSGESTTQRGGGEDKIHDPLVHWQDGSVGKGTSGQGPFTSFWKNNAELAGVGMRRHYSNLK